MQARGEARWKLECTEGKLRGNRIGEGTGKDQGKFEGLTPIGDPEKAYVVSSRRPKSSRSPKSGTDWGRFSARRAAKTRSRPPDARFGECPGHAQVLHRLKVA